MKNILLPEIIECIAQHLDGNEIACTFRLVDKTTARLFAGHVRVRLSRPVPSHAFRDYWAQPHAMRPLSFYQRCKLLDLTAASGCLANLEVVVQHAGCDLTAPSLSGHEAMVLDPLAAAAAAGHMHICARLLHHGCVLGGHHLIAAAQAGRQDMCSWMLDLGCRWDAAAVYAAARGGHVHLMDWLLARRPDVDAAPIARVPLLEAAAEGCDLATLRRVYQAEGVQRQGDERLLCDVVAAASRSVTPDWQAKVAWLEEQGVLRAREACQAATSCADAVERLQWLRARGYRVGEVAVHTAAAAGGVAALQYLLSLDDRPGRLRHGMDYARTAAMHNQLAVLQKLHAGGFLSDTERTNACLTEALYQGHVEIVYWLFDVAGATLLQQLQWRFQDSLIYEEVGYACKASYKMEFLEWLHARGCRLPESRALAVAAAAGSEEVMEWLLAHGYRFQDDGKTYLKPIERGDLATLCCLRRLGCPWGRGVKTFLARECSPGVRAWLDEVGLPYKVVTRDYYTTMRTTTDDNYSGDFNEVGCGGW